METMNEIQTEGRAVALPGKLPFTFRARARSFVYAFWGIGALLRREHNAWIHLVAAAAAAGLGWALGISGVEWCLVAFAVGSVLAAEAFNTALEALADAVHPKNHPGVGRSKDLAAGGVLLVSLAAAAVGLIVFGPKLWAWVSR